jgi:uncharacterized membrane protein
MPRPRLLAVLCSALVTMLVFAPIAGATTYGGQGLYGETNDVVITNAMFATIIFFPVVIIVFSLLQAYLDKRKHARMDAAKARATSADWQGGW